MESFGPDEENVTDSLLFNRQDRLGRHGVEQNFVDHSEPHARPKINAGPVTGRSEIGPRNS